MALASSMARCTPSSGGFPSLVSLPDTGSSVAILIIAGPLEAGALPVVDVPDPQATNIVNSRGMPIANTKKRKQIFLMKLLASFGTIRHKYTQETCAEKNCAQVFFLRKETLDVEYLLA